MDLINRLKVYSGEPRIWLLMNSFVNKYDSQIENYNAMAFIGKFYFVLLVLLLLSLLAYFMWL